MQIHQGRYLVDDKLIDAAFALIRIEDERAASGEPGVTALAAADNGSLTDADVARYIETVTAVIGDDPNRLTVFLFLWRFGGPFDPRRGEDVDLAPYRAYQRGDREAMRAILATRAREFRPRLGALSAHQQTLAQRLIALGHEWRLQARAALERGGEVPSTFAMVLPDGQVVMFPGIAESGHKHDAVKAVCREAEQQHAIGGVFIAEVFKPEDPQRAEALCISPMLFRQGWVQAWLWPFRRDGTTVIFDEVDWDTVSGEGPNRLWQPFWDYPETH
jgi:hypothetical protein